MIKLEKIEKLYIGTNIPVHALKEINLTIDRNEFIAIMGPSGSGKSTLINIIGCLDRPSSGIYYLDNQNVSIMNNTSLARFRNKKLGFVFQNFNLLNRLSVLENIELPLLYCGMNKKDRHESVLKLLHKLELINRINHYPTELSGGQKQRVAIARALVNQPQIILADEPTGSLDSRMGEEILEIFTMLHREGTTIILVTHDLDVAKYASRIIYFRDGNIVSDVRNKRK